MNNNYDVIIVGGSYSGLSAAMALGRALRNVLIIDAGEPCNKQTPHSHNFLTQDGKTPLEISTEAKKQVLSYPTVAFHSDYVTDVHKKEKGFTVETRAGAFFNARKLILATGIKDTFPEIPGFKECWGISIIHCPYCHGYEYKYDQTGILANGDMAYHMVQLISNWTKKLTLFTNEKSTLTAEQQDKIKSHHIEIIEKDIAGFKHNKGHLEHIQFLDGSSTAAKAIYARLPFVHSLSLLGNLGCELTEHGYIKVDMMQKTSIDGIYACGDNTSMMRSIANAVFTGSMGGAAANMQMIEEDFNNI